MTDKEILELWRKVPDMFDYTDAIAFARAVIEKTREEDAETVEGFNNCGIFYTDAQYQVDPDSSPVDDIARAIRERGKDADKNN